MDKDSRDRLFQNRHARASDSAPLASFLEAERDAILELFVQRSPEEMASPCPPSRLVDPLARLIDEIVTALRTVSPVPPASTGKPELRFADGESVETVVREYGTFLDCMLEKLEEHARPVSVRELRVITACIASASREAVARCLERQRAAAAAAQVQRLEHELRGSEERFRTVLETIDDGFCVIELLPDEAGRYSDWIYTHANRAFERHSGFTDAVGKRIRQLVPNHDQFWFDLYTKVAVTGEPARAEFHAQAMGRWFDVFAVRLGELGSREVAIVFKDTTEQKRTEAAREELLALETSARARAEDAGRMKDEFLATLSHELRTPLHSMIGWISLLQSGRLAPDKHERALATIARNAYAQAKLIEDLLDMSRIMAGKLRLELTPVDLGELVEYAIESARPDADAKSISLHGELTEGAVVQADSQRLQQVVRNLLSNAVKFTPSGGHVRVSLICNESGAAELLVTDTGRGIASDFLPHVFERFRQASAGTASGHVGLGLGLAISQQLVELHGGTIHASSAGVGLGASFTVRLPLVRDSVPAVASETSLDRRLENLDIVVVDDDADSREMLAMALQTAGLRRVRLAPSAAACMTLLAERTPDVVIADLGMPEEDGYTFLSKLRARFSEDPLHGLPVIALTASAREEDRTHAMAAGFDAFLTKPLDVRTLIGALEHVSQR